MLPKYHFGAWQDKTVPVFSVKSHWEPTEYIFPPLQKYFRHVLKDITDLYQQPTTNKVNLSQDEIKALRELNQRQNKNLHDQLVHTNFKSTTNNLSETHQ